AGVASGIARVPTVVLFFLLVDKFLLVDNFLLVMLFFLLVDDFLLVILILLLVDFSLCSFWSTATLRAPELGPPAILATINKTPYTITEELVRSRLYLADDGGSGAEVAEKAVPHPMPAPDQSLTHLPTLSRPQSSDPVAPVLEHDHISDPHETTAGSFLTREDAPLGGNFYTSPPRSSQAPPAGQPSGGEEDPITLTALSSVVSTLVQKVKTLEVKLKTKKRKLVVSDSDQEDGDTQYVDLDALRALANAAVAADSDIPSGSTSKIPASSPSVPTASPPGTFGVPPATFAIPPGAFDAPTGALAVLPGTSTVPTAALGVPTDSPNVPAADSPNVPAGVSSKGKSLMVEEDILVKVRTFRKMKEDRLGEEAAKRLHDEEMAQMERERAETQRQRQQEVLDSAMYYNESDWLNIRAQVEANASLSKTLLGDDVFEENFPSRMAALIKKKRQALAEQLFEERQNQPMTPAQQKAYMQQYAKAPEAPTSSMPEVLIIPTVTSPPSSSTRRKTLGRKHMHKSKSTFPKLDLNAPAQRFLKVVVNEDSDNEDSDDEVWSAVVGWEVLPTPLGAINALYHIDCSTKHFATLHQILHMEDRQDLMKLYGLVV
nr:JmjC domain-containing protein [Tanacetum cinerariifolium]